MASRDAQRSVLELKTERRGQGQSRRHRLGLRPQPWLGRDREGCSGAGVSEAMPGVPSRARRGSAWGQVGTLVVGGEARAPHEAVGMEALPRWPYGSVQLLGDLSTGPAATSHVLGPRPLQGQR